MDRRDRLFGELRELTDELGRRRLWLQQQGCDVIALPQFSMARAQAAVQQVLDLPVLTTPASAVRLLRQRLGA